MRIEGPQEPKPPRKTEDDSWDVPFDREPGPTEIDAFVPARPIGMDGR
jgi:hypothetical protein